MKNLKTILKFTLQSLFVIIFFSTVEAKNPEHSVNGRSVSNYFSGILSLNNNQYGESYKYFNRLNNFEINHLNFAKKYLFTLINLGKINEAFNFAKKLEKKNLSTFESDLVIGVYFVKNQKYDLAQKYFLKIKNEKKEILLNSFITESMLNWVDLDNTNLESAKRKINSTEPVFENLKRIQNVFLHCYFNDDNADIFFKKLVNDKNIDFSRYNYFYVSFLHNSGRVQEAKNILDSSTKTYPRNLLLNQYKIDLNKNENFKSNFNCKDRSNVIAEIFYITANAFSSQSMYSLSNFYLNLSKYLNKDFSSFDTLLAENFYKIENFKKSKKIYDQRKKQGSTYLWYAAKQKAKILLIEKKDVEAIKLMTDSYKKLTNKNFYDTFDFAEFLKRNEKYEEAINYYSKIIQLIDKTHPLYPEITDGRGVAYERLGEWENAEQDLLASLEADPDQAYVINYLAYSWIEKGVKIEKSLKMLERANNLKSNDPYIIDSLGWALFKLKKYERSKNYLQMAVQLMPADPIVNDHFGDVLWRYGNKIQARYYWSYVLNLEETEDELKNQVRKKLILGL